MRPLEVIREPLSRHRITVAKDRVTLKIRDDTPPDIEANLVALAEGVAEYIGIPEHTMRGRVNPQSLADVQMSGGGNGAKRNELRSFRLEPNGLVTENTHHWRKKCARDCGCLCHEPGGSDIEHPGQPCPGKEVECRA